jgi:iron-sulfur cluster repair protein YtfE (RIC family)
MPDDGHQPSSLEARPETVRGRLMYHLLLSVHTEIRKDLERVERLAEDALGGRSAAELGEELDEIKRDSRLWRLRVDCLRHCRFVHMHHNAEDGSFFPELRATNPAINSVIDRLQADHRRVSDDLDAVEAAAKALADEESDRVRKAVDDALRTLGANLLEHLEYEERNLEATVLRLREYSNE